MISMSDWFLIFKRVKPPLAIEQSALSDTELITDTSRFAVADLYIIAVPTPLNTNREPDVTALYDTSSIVAGHMTEGNIVVYEATVYPGLTEEEFIPILEKQSDLACGTDFNVGILRKGLIPTMKYIH